MKKTALFLYFLIPSFVFAADFSLAGQNFKSIIQYISSMVFMLIPILISIAFIVFFWGLSKFVIGADNDQEVKKGKEFMLWGILALFILVSIRSILGIIAGDLEIGDGRTIPLLPIGEGGVPHADVEILPTGLDGEYEIYNP